MSVETPPPADLQQADVPMPVIKPRLSIMHLMVWTGLSAAVMGFLQWAAPSNSTSLSWIDAVIRAVYAMYGGVVVGGLCLFVARRVRRLPFPTEPGEWLLVIQGAMFLLLFASFPLAKLYTNPNPNFAFLVEVYRWVYAIVLLAAGLGPLICYRTPGPWRWFFWAYAGRYCVIAISIPIMIFGPEATADVQWWISIALAVAAYLLFFVAIGVDGYRRTPRGWVHWVGVVSLAFSVGWELIQEAIVRYFY